MSASDGLFSIPEIKTDDASSQGGAFELRKKLLELANRRIEGLKLYEPMPVQAAFEMSHAKERVLRGSNQSGKTLSAAVEIARAVTGQDKYGRYPERDGICYAVGFDGKHLADPMWKKLSKAGAFKIIRDEKTNRWRTYRPWMPDDAKRESEARPAPPLIPPRFIESIAWEEKKMGIPKMVKLTTGWQLHFFSGNARPPQGSQADLAWFDEELADGEWYPEIAFRLFAKKGWFIWSATPQAGTDRLYTLHERAEKQVEQNVIPRTVEEFICLVDNNLHMTDQQKREIYDKLDEDDREVRVAGEFSRIHRVFPEYSSKIHEIAYRVIPHDWTRYIAIDPGRQVCAALFVAVPPPTSDEANHLFVYDEIYVRECDAVLFGEAMERKCRDQAFRAFIIDPNEAAKHETGSGVSIEDQYKAQLRLKNVSSQLSGHGFIYGNDNVLAGLEALRLWFKKPRGAIAGAIRDRVSAPPKIRIITERCPNFIWELKRYKYARIKGIPGDKPEKRNDHLVDCARYLAQYGPEWSAVTKLEHDAPVWRAYQQFLKATRGNMPKGLMLGPGK